MFCIRCTSVAAGKLLRCTVPVELKVADQLSVLFSGVNLVTKRQDMLEIWVCVAVCSPLSTPLFSTRAITCEGNLCNCLKAFQKFEKYQLNSIFSVLAVNSESNDRMEFRGIRTRKILHNTPTEHVFFCTY